MQSVYFMRYRKCANWHNSKSSFKKFLQNQLKCLAAQMKKQSAASAFFKSFVIVKIVRFRIEMGFKKRQKQEQEYSNVLENKKKSRWNSDIISLHLFPCFSFLCVLHYHSDWSIYWNDLRSNIPYWSLFLIEANHMRLIMRKNSRWQIIIISIKLGIKHSYGVTYI